MKKVRSAEDQALLDRLIAMSDDDIDTDDIPEAPAENWALARRPGVPASTARSSATSPCGSTRT